MFTDFIHRSRINRIQFSQHVPVDKFNRAIAVFFNALTLVFNLSIVSYPQIFLAFLAVVRAVHDEPLPNRLQA